MGFILSKTQNLSFVKNVFFFTVSLCFQMFGITFSVENSTYFPQYRTESPPDRAPRRPASPSSLWGGRRVGWAAPEGMPGPMSLILCSGSLFRLKNQRIFLNIEPNRLRIDPPEAQQARRRSGEVGGGLGRLYGAPGPHQSRFLVRDHFLINNSSQRSNYQESAAPPAARRNCTCRRRALKF